MIFKQDKDKDFNCRQCGAFLDKEELVDSKCPNCKTDEDLFINNLKEN